VAATLGNIGPGLARVGAVENFAFFPADIKLLLAFDMLLGRLEIYTVFTLLLPVFWRR
jgi:trk system potassium uptake protein TrkH